MFQIILEKKTVHASSIFLKYCLIKLPYVKDVAMYDGLGMFGKLRRYKSNSQSRLSCLHSLGVGASILGLLESTVIVEKRGRYL